MKRCRHIHSSPLILGLLCNHVTRYFGICAVVIFAVVTFSLLFLCPRTTLFSLSSSCSKSAGFTPADPWCVILSLFHLDPCQYSLKDKTSQFLFPTFFFFTLAFDLLIIVMSQIRPSESDIPNHTSFESLVPLSLLGPTFFCSLTPWDFWELFIPSPFEPFGSFLFPHPLSL